MPESPSHAGSTAAPDTLPPGLHCAQDHERLAQERIPTGVLAYIEGGSGQEQTLRRNRAAFARQSILPRLLQPLQHGHTRLSLLGHELAHPVLLAPVAWQKLVHTRGEIETAQAAAATDTCMVLSTLSSCTLEEVAKHAATRWFQLYWQASREHTLSLVRRAEASGYSAIAVTLDASVQTPSLRALRAGFRFPGDVCAANLQGLPSVTPPAWQANDSAIFQGVMSTAPVWDDVRWLRAQTSLPLLIKGVLREDDALRLRELGADGLIVSNHGGRALDGVPASLDRLPALRQAVGPDFPLLLDSGVRSGQDVFKALALGANAALIGRLQVHALAVGGALGVAHLLRTLREELELCMAQAGCATLADITPDLVQPHLTESPC